MENYYLLDVNYSSHNMSYVFEKLEDLKSFLSDLRKKNEILNVGILKYNLIYNHGNLLPKPDGYNKFFEENTYNENYKQEKVVTVKSKDYKHKIQDSSEIFKIRYQCLDKVEKFQDTEWPLNYYRELNCVYNANSKKKAMEMLYQHSKKKAFYNLRLYQCERINIK